MTKEILNIPANIACRVIIDGYDSLDHAYMIINNREKTVVNFPGERIGISAAQVSDFKPGLEAYILDIPKGSTGEGLNVNRMASFAKNLQGMIDFRKLYYKARLYFISKHSQNFPEEKIVEIASDVGKFRNFIDQLCAQTNKPKKIENSLKKAFKRVFRRKSFSNQKKFAPTGLVNTAVMDSFHKKPIRFHVNRILYDVNFCCSDAVGLTLSAGGSQAIAVEHRLVSSRYTFFPHHLVAYLSKIEKKLKIKPLFKRPEIKNSVSKAVSGRYNMFDDIPEKDRNGIPVYDKVKNKKKNVASIQQQSIQSRENIAPIVNRQNPYPFDQATNDREMQEIEQNLERGRIEREENLRELQRLERQLEAYVEEERQARQERKQKRIAKLKAGWNKVKSSGYTMGLVNLGVGIGVPILTSVAVDLALPNTHHNKKEAVNAGLGFLGGLWMQRRAYYQATSQMPFYNTSYVAGQTNSLMQSSKHMAKRAYRVGRTTYRLARPLITKKTAVVVGAATGAYKVVTAKPENADFYQKGSYHYSFGAMNDLTGNTLMAGLLAPAHWSAHKLASWRLYSKPMRAVNFITFGLLGSSRNISKIKRIKQKREEKRRLEQIQRKLREERRRSRKIIALKKEILKKQIALMKQKNQKEAIRLYAKRFQFTYYLSKTIYIMQYFLTGSKEVNLNEKNQKLKHLQGIIGHDANVNWIGQGDKSFLENGRYALNLLNDLLSQVKSGKRYKKHSRHYMKSYKRMKKYGSGYLKLLKKMDVNKVCKLERALPKDVRKITINLDKMKSKSARRNIVSKIKGLKSVYSTHKRQANVIESQIKKLCGKILDIGSI